MFLLDFLFHFTYYTFTLLIAQFYYIVLLLENYDFTVSLERGY